MGDQKYVNTQNTVKGCSYDAHTSDSSDVNSESATYVHEQQNNAVKSNESVVQQPKKQQAWIQREQYAEHMKQKRLDEQMNKEPFTPKSMIKSWEDGMTGNPNATKGIPEHLLNNPVIANMLKMKGKDRNNNV